MTLPPHGPPEITEAQQAATSLGEVEDPTPDNVSRALQDYSPYAVASAAASLGASGGGGGGSQAVELLGPFPITYQTAGLDNPPDNGALIGPVLTAGTLVLAAWIETTTPWAATVSVDEVDLILNTSTAALLKIDSAADTVLNAASYQLIADNDPFTPPSPTFIQTGTDQIALAFYSTANLTAGAGNVYALTASI